MGTYASFLWDLLRDRIIATNRSMTDINKGMPLTKGWAPGTWYGLGLRKYYVKSSDNRTLVVGHGGQDYGTNILVSAYSERYDFSMVMAADAVSGMNCTPEYRERYPLNIAQMYNDRYYDETACQVFGEVVNFLSNGTEPHIECSTGSMHIAAKSSTSNFSCVWDALPKPVPNDERTGDSNIII